MNALAFSLVYIQKPVWLAKTNSCSDTEYSISVYRISII